MHSVSLVQNNVCSLGTGAADFTISLRKQGECGRSFVSCLPLLIIEEGNSIQPCEKAGSTAAWWTKASVL